MKTTITDGIAKLVAIVLAQYADDAGMSWPKVETLADQCSQSARTVQRKIRVLEAEGIIAVIPHVEGGRQRSNRYRFNAIADARPPGGRLRRGDRSVAAADPASTGDTQSPMPENEGEGCHTVTGTGDTADTPRVTLLSPYKNPPLEPPVGRDSPQPPDAGGRGRPRVFRGNGIAEPVRPVQRRRDAPAPLDPATAAKFEALWSTFPEGGIAYADRVAAERTFAELPPADQDLAVAAVRGYRAQLERDGSKPKALHSWLRIRRFANVRQAPGASIAATAAAGPRVFVESETPAWEAWADHDRRAGRVPRSPSWSDAQRAEGWWFPSEFPPARSSAA